MGLVRKPTAGSVEAELISRRRREAEATRERGEPSEPARGRDPRYLVGVDLGQVRDFSTVAVAEVASEEPLTLHIRHLERWRGLPYTEVVERVQRLLDSPQLARSELVIDGTGVGRGVVDLFSRSGRRFTAVTITGGDRVSNPQRGVYGVPKKDLVGALQVMLEAGRLKIASSLEHAETLRTELLNFRVRTSLTTGRESFEHWRESDTDDLVLAAALAGWKASYKTPEPRIRKLRIGG